MTTVKFLDEYDVGDLEDEVDHQENQQQQGLPEPRPSSFIFCTFYYTKTG
jgi:hypothetical protein